MNDRITSALQNGDLKLAINLAYNDRNSLKLYHYQDILSYYFEDLFDQKESVLVATETTKFLGNDAILWERWINAFIKNDYLLDILNYIPTNNPRLSKQIYELVLETLLIKDSKLFLTILKSWLNIKPLIFTISIIIARLELIRERDLNSFLMESLALLYLYLKKYEKALNCYLEINYELELSQEMNINYINNSEFNETNESNNTVLKQTNDYIHVFELIEREHLIHLISDKIINLMRLSIDLSLKLLLKYIDDIPIVSVIKQLKYNKKFLYHYLNFIFKKYEPYNNSSNDQYSEFHMMQVALYVEFTPVSNNRWINAPNATNIMNESANELSSDSTEDQIITLNKIDNSNNTFNELIQYHQHNLQLESEFMIFLKTSQFYFLDFALRECQKRKPPLYNEMVYILDRKGMRKEALVSQFISFIAFEFNSFNDRI